jgi:hypothetical protein
MTRCKICHAVIAVVVAADLICTSCQGAHEPGIVPDNSFEMKPEHTEREGQEIISFSNPIIGQAPGANAIYGSEFSPQSQFKSWNVAKAFTLLNRGWSSSSWLPAESFDATFAPS